MPGDVLSPEPSLPFATLPPSPAPLALPPAAMQSPLALQLSPPVIASPTRPALLSPRPEAEPIIKRPTVRPIARELFEASSNPLLNMDMPSVLPPSNGPAIPYFDNSPSNMSARARVIDLWPRDGRPVVDPFDDLDAALDDLAHGFENNFEFTPTKPPSPLTTPRCPDAPMKPPANWTLERLEAITDARSLLQFFNQCSEGDWTLADDASFHTDDGTVIYDMRVWDHPLVDDMCVGPRAMVNDRLVIKSFYERYPNLVPRLEPADVEKVVRHFCALRLVAAGRMKKEAYTPEPGTAALIFLVMFYAIRDGRLNILVGR